MNTVSDKITSVIRDYHLKKEQLNQFFLMIDAGSDAANISTEAVETCNSYIVTGRKAW